MNQLQKDIKTILLYVKNHSQDGLLEYELAAYKRLKHYSEQDLSYDGGNRLWVMIQKNYTKNTGNEN